MDHTESYTAGNETELKEAAQRINAFEQELIGKGLRVISSGTTTIATGGTRKQFVLTGDFGNLHNLEVTLWTSDRLEMERPHFSVGARTQIRNDTEEREFKLLEKRLQLVATGLERP